MIHARPKPERCGDALISAVGVPSWASRGPSLLPHRSHGASREPFMGAIWEPWYLGSHGAIWSLEGHKWGALGTTWEPFIQPLGTMGASKGEG